MRAPCASRLSAARAFDPHPPVFPAHHSDGIGDFILRGGSERDVYHFFGVELDGAAGEFAADGLEHRVVGDAGARMGALGRGQAVDDQVERREIAADDVDGLPLAVVGKRIAVQVSGVDAVARGKFCQRSRVVVASRGGLVAVGRPLEKYAKRARAVAPGCSDARGQAVAGGSADDQHVARPAVGGWPAASSAPPRFAARRCGGSPRDGR